MSTHLTINLYLDRWISALSLRNSVVDRFDSYAGCQVYLRRRFPVAESSQEDQPLLMAVILEIVCEISALMGHWCRGLTRLPVTE